MFEIRNKATISKAIPRNTLALRFNEGKTRSRYDTYEEINSATIRPKQGEKYVSSQLSRATRL